MTIIIGVSGGIASGKNFVSDCFLEFGAKIFDADQEVSKLFSDDNDFKNKIIKNFPNAIKNNKINKDLIAKEVFLDKKRLNLLESITHPIINSKIDNFIIKCKKDKIKIALLNIPLLFEKESYKKCDLAILIISDFNLRKKRFIAREMAKNSKLSNKLLSQKFDNIILNQKTDQEKKKLASEIIYNNSDQQNIVNQIKLILQKYENHYS
jgi:dephospho-CoA kinase